MQLRLEQWLAFMAIDDATISTLREFVDVVAPRIDEVMDALYARIASFSATSALFHSPESINRARAQQKKHWMEAVFLGKFDNDYLQTTKTIGQTHFRLGVDHRFFVGAYSVVLNEVVRIATEALSDRPADLNRYIAALNRATFMDMGLATSVYYDSLMQQLEEMSNELNLSLARAGEFRDNETGRHIMRMSHMCEALALAMGKTHKWSHMLRIASPLHDVGKIGIPDHILLKPGRLDADELETMRTHTSIGGEIIPDHMADVIVMARRVALTHHERWDGTGYPTGLKGEEIPLEGRIAAICDVYDALVSARPYKKPWTTEQAVDHLRANSGSHFDPHLVETFLTILPEVDAIQKRFAEDLIPAAQ